MNHPPLFRQRDFSKVAASPSRSILRLPEDSVTWPEKLLSALYQYVPGVSSYVPDVNITKQSPEEGAALGFFGIRNSTQQPSPDGPGNYIRVPFIVKEWKVSPLDVFEVGGTLYPLTKETLDRAMLNPSTFTHPENPRTSGPNVFGDQLPPFSAQTGGMFGKMASAPMRLLEKIAGTARETDAAEFAKVAAGLPGAGEWLGTLPGIRKLAQAGFVSAAKIRKQMEKAASAPRLDVLQVYPYMDGYMLKVSAGPTEVAPQEIPLPAEQAKQVLPQSTLDTADQQGVATVTSVQAQPDTFIENPTPIMQMGIYRVLTPDGNPLTGYVFPEMLDPVTGAPAPMKLFTNGNSYALQQEILGTLIALTQDLPRVEDIRGLGIFYRFDGRRMLVTVPYTVSGKVTVEGLSHYAALDQMNQNVQISAEPGVMEFYAVQDPMTGQMKIIMPEDACFLPLNGRIELEAGQNMAQDGGVPMKTAMYEARDSMATITAWPDGTVKLGGPVFAKVGSGVHHAMDALLYLALAGCPQNVALPLIKDAAATGREQRLFNLLELDTPRGTLEKAAAAAQEDIPTLAIKPVNLLPELYNICKAAASPEVLTAFHRKTAAADPIVSATTVDTILGLGFMNPDNIESFTDSIPVIEDAASKLASLLMVQRISEPGLPEGDLVRAMTSLMTVAESLRQIQDA